MPYDPNTHYSGPGGSVQYGTPAYHGGQAQTQMSQAPMSQASISQAPISQAHMSQAQMSQAQICQAPTSQAGRQRQRAGQAEVVGYSQPVSNIYSHPIPQQPNQYRQPADRNSQAPTYSTPQFYDPGPSSFHPTSPSMQYPQSLQQPYQSPPVRPDQIAQPQYSPGPSQYYHAQSNPRQATPSHNQSIAHQQRQAPPPPPTSQSSRHPPSSLGWQNPPPQQWPTFTSTADQQSSGPRAQRQHNPPSLQQNHHHMQRHPSQARPPSATSQPSSIRPTQPSPQLAPQSLQAPPSPNLTRPPPAIQGQNRAPHVSRAQQGQQPPRPTNTPSRPPATTRLQSTPLADPQHQLLHPQALQSDPPGTINPAMVQRRVLVPVIPIQKATPRAQQAEVASSPHSPKRRKSNDSHAIPVCEPSRASQMQRVKQAPPASSPLTERASSQFPPTPTPANIDYQAVLLNLSNEYVSAAYNMSSALAMPEVSEEQLDVYHSLLSTGMGCLESALKNFRAMDARVEARIRLRLASLLYEETDNDAEGEEILSKGLSACERARLPELKYAMLHLLARLWHKGGKSKAAMKAVEKHITEVEKLNLVHWIYAFRFLRVSLGLQADNSYVESSALVRQLTAINAVADRRHDVAVQIVASTMEALIHLRSRTPDSVDLAQRALAAARMHQTSPEMAAMPQARALLNYIDLGCSIMHFNPEQASAKMHLMHGDLDSANRDSSWCHDGSWHVQLGAIRTSSTNIDADTGGVVRMFNGQPSLVFKWFTKIQLCILAFMFSSLSSMHKNASTEQKAEAFLDEALKLSKIPIEPAQQSISAASTQYNTQRLLRVNLRLYVVFAFCGRSDWDKALKGIENIRKDIDELEEDPGADIMSLITYLEAVCKHGLADLKGALKLYQSPQLQVPSHVDAKAAAGGISPIRVLAALNGILIMRHFGKREEADRLLTAIEPACHVQSTSYGSEYGSKAIESAFMILKATEPRNRAANNLILQTKQRLQVAVSAAKIALNNQLLCIVMTIMTDLFFHNIVGDQAEKSARAGRTLAKKSQDKLWTAVADRMYGNTLEKCGKGAEAAAVRREAQEAMERMPESLKTALLIEKMEES